MTSSSDDRIIKETMLHLRELPPIKRVKVDKSTLHNVKCCKWRVRPRVVACILHTLHPHEEWSLLIRGRVYAYRTEAEALAFMKGKYTNIPSSLSGLTFYPFELQLFGDLLPRDKEYYANPVVQHLKTGDKLGIHPWCVQYRGGGTYFSTFAEVCAYIEGRWGRYIGEESVYA